MVGLFAFLNVVVVLAPGHDQVAMFAKYVNVEFELHAGLMW